ncbi:MAG TPA: hypothetical protein VMZ53_07675 [Kofleriaceae bacterium]|nr:hypothetical protein [Kofleriaceae bacterium]
MKKLALGVLLAGLLVATGCGGDDHPHITLDAGSAATTCDPLKQTGCAANEKCTWLLDALMPQYVGHIGCAPDGAANVGEQCVYGAPGTSGYDNCKKGTVCGNYRGGMDVCKALCDQQGGMPECDATHVCVIYSKLFATSDTTPPAAGVCDLACDPFADNDFDGSGAMTKTGTTCGSGQGCYGYPSYGTPPKTGWSCTRDINNAEAQPIGLRHRVQCTEDNNCADAGPTIYTNSCNQGYLPLLRESTTVSTTICVAICKPLSCYNGNCGTNDIKRKGEGGNACTSNDRVAGASVMMTHDTAATHPNDEQCEFLWRREIDAMSGDYLPSETKDTVGFCFDHSQYQYDSNGDNVADIDLPPCGALVQGFGSGSDLTDPLTYWGAADLGCVTSDEAGVNMAQGKAKLPAGTLEKWRRVNMPRALYHRQANIR